ncbi:MAG: OmpA family protein [candidate division NC10 bacterium]|nr:OmpA family protein [candidate division NC10 bacterium]
MSRLIPRSERTARWLLTYADMITLLLAFFVVMYAMSRVDAKKYEAMAISIHAAFRGGPPILFPARHEEPQKPPARTDPVPPLMQQISAGLVDDLRAGRIQIDRVADAVVLRFPDAILFERGSAEIRDEAQALLDKVGGIIGTLPNAIEAEGHSDTLPIRSTQFPSNWELSVARATAVVRYLVETQGISPVRLAARGLGEHKPLFPNDPAHGEPRNRRVEIRIVAH